VISCYATDNDDDKVNVYFYDNSTGNLIDNAWADSGSVFVVWKNLQREQSYTFFARAQDEGGEWSENSNPCSFLVNSLIGGDQATSPTSITQEIVLMVIFVFAIIAIIIFAKIKSGEGMSIKISVGVKLAFILIAVLISLTSFAIGLKWRDGQAELKSDYQKSIDQIVEQAERGLITWDEASVKVQRVLIQAHIDQVVEQAEQGLITWEEASVQIQEIMSVVPSPEIPHGTST
jgi:hypothetical protein